jgi:enterobactin synthetase component D
LGKGDEIATFAEHVRQALPRVVGVGLRRQSDGQPPALYPLEEQYLGPNAAQQRRISFALGRAAARDALAELGLDGAMIGRGAGGEPLWPDGIVGAITHSGDLAIAVVGWRTDYAGIGIDIEQQSPGLSAKAARLVCTPAEFAWIDEQPSANRRTMLFSAKEAIFKALFPIERVWLGFGDAELRWQAERDAFEARLLKSAGRDYPVGSMLEVDCRLMEGQVLSTTYALPANRSAM